MSRPRTQVLTARRIDVLRYINEHGSVTADEWQHETGSRQSTVSMQLHSMHRAGYLRILRYERRRQGPAAPVFGLPDGKPDATRPPSLKAEEKSRRYRERVKREQGSVKKPRQTGTAYDIFVLGRL